MNTIFHDKKKDTVVLNFKTIEKGREVYRRITFDSVFEAQQYCSEKRINYKRG